MRSKLPLTEILGAVILGVAGGFYIFQPALQQLRDERLRNNTNTSGVPPSSSNLSSSSSSSTAATITNNTDKPSSLR